MDHSIVSECDLLEFRTGRLAQCVNFNVCIVWIRWVKANFIAYVWVIPCQINTRNGHSSDFAKVW